MASDAKDLLQRRKANMLRNQALMNDLKLKALPSKAATPKKVVKKQPRVKEELLPSRKSLRLQNVTPDNVTQKRQIEQVLEQRLEDERAKKRRRTGDLDVKDLIGSSHFDSMGNFLKGLTPTKTKEIIFNIDEAKKTTQRDVREAIETFDKLSLWENIAPNSIKVVPERAVCSPDASCLNMLTNYHSIR
jgi:hypothetical protein